MPMCFAFLTSVIVALLLFVQSRHGVAMKILNQRTLNGIWSSVVKSSLKNAENGGRYARY
jgi:hypothetical protein